jgi:L-aminopeptidase/D-esterase-like protein
MTDILLPEGVLIGHADNKITGVTVILCPDGAVGGADVRGCAPGTRETDLLRPEKAIEKVNAVVFCCGSAYGLGACDGVMRFLRENNKGHKIGNLVVPLVAGAVIYDLNSGEYNYPDADMGYNACLAAKADGLRWGGTGVGTGATCSKTGGPAMAVKAGVSAATVALGGLFVTAVTVVNALGDVFDPGSGKQISGARLPGGGVLNAKRLILSGEILKSAQGSNTTLSCVITNAKLTKLQANKLASISHDAYARCINPVHTDYDGDTVFALSRGDINTDFMTVSVMAVEAVSRSIVSAVR